MLSCNNPIFFMINKSNIVLISNIVLLSKMVSILSFNSSLFDDNDDDKTKHPHHHVRTLSNIKSINKKFGMLNFAAVFRVQYLGFH